MEADRESESTLPQDWDPIQFFTGNRLKAFYVEERVLRQSMGYFFRPKSFVRGTLRLKYGGRG
jgi:hypothetical protein